MHLSLLRLISLRPTLAALLTLCSQASESALKGGDEVRIVGFGTFSVAQRAATTGRNPRTGETIQIAASKQPKFKAGAPLKDAVNS